MRFSEELNLNHLTHILKICFQIKSLMNFDSNNTNLNQFFGIEIFNILKNELY